MIFLLTNYSIFLELQNGCYIQLTGLAINKLPSSFTIKQTNFYKIHKKRSFTEETSSKSKVIVLNNRDVVKKKHLDEKNNLDVIKVPNINPISNLRFSRSVMFFGSPIYNKYNEPWYGLPKERKY
jgi:hypothetical protein